MEESGGQIRESTIVGGFSEVEPAYPYIQEMVDKVKSKLVHYGGKANYPKFKAISYKVACGPVYKYYIKVDVGDEHIHMKVFYPIRGERELKEVHFNKTREDALDFEEGY